MTRQSISLTDPNDAWLMAQVESNEYTSKSDVVNDLIRRACEAEQTRELIRAKLIAAEQSGFVTRDREELLKKFKAQKKHAGNSLVLGVYKSTTYSACSPLPRHTKAHQGTILAHQISVRTHSCHRP